MRVVTKTIWLPKEGNTDEEYEDAASPRDPVDVVADSFKCAVADGATETSFSGLWAQLLVAGYIDDLEMADLQKKWKESISGKQLSWYAEEKAQSGAFATLIGLSVQDGKNGNGGTWESEAIGDSCLMHVRGSEVLSAFPLTKSEEFNSSPYLLSSNEQNNEKVADKFVTVGGEWLPGDNFYLLTDAIARWAFKRQEEYADAAVWLSSMSDKDALAAFAEVQRHVVDSEMRPMMRNDDVTLMRISLE